MYFYQKADVLYQMTVIFCKRFLPPYGDRTVDQMVQAARSGKQNIVEGAADGVASMEMEIKMLNVARGSIKELREDYRDYLKVHSLKIWEAQHERYDRMLRFCRIHNRVEEYAPLFENCLSYLNTVSSPRAAASVSSRVPKQDRRTYPSPPWPKPSPGVTTIWAFSSSSRKKSQPLLPSGQGSHR